MRYTYFQFCILFLGIFLTFAFHLKFPPTRPSHVQVKISPSTAAELPKSSIKAQLAIDMKSAMLGKEKNRLAAIRAIQSAIKQREVDDRVDVTDEMIVNIMTKLIKQRKESIKSFEDGGRPDLVALEQEECDVISAYLPKQLDWSEVERVVLEAILKTGASSIKEMGKVIAAVKPTLTGKTDMAAVSELIKRTLGKS